MRELDLVSGFDVTDPAAWEHVGSVDLACLNAGVLTGGDGIANLTDDEYRRAVGVNVDGVVYGVRRLDRVMPKGGVIVVTASLAGLVGIPDDPIYGLTKHAVVGFVRSVAPQLAERGIRIQAVCPGWADTGSCPRPSRRSSRNAATGSSGRRASPTACGRHTGRGHRRGVDRAARTRAPAVRVQGRAGAALMLTRAAPSPPCSWESHSPPRPVGRRRSRRRRTSPPRRRLPPAGFLAGAAGSAGAREEGRAHPEPHEFFGFHVTRTSTSS